MSLKQSMITVPRTGRNIEVWQKGSGPDIVYCHGAGGMVALEPHLEQLASSYRVTVPMFPGFGKSDGIESIDDVLDAVMHNFDVLDALGIQRPILMGHSMGGMLAAEMAAICPNDVARLVLIAPLGLWDDAHPVVDFFTIMPGEFAPYVFYDQTHPMALAMSAMPAPDNEELIEIYVNYVKGLSAAGRLLWPIPDRGLVKRIGRTKAPTLVLWGSEDKLVPVFYADEFARQIPGARKEIIAEASHMLPVEQTQRVVESIRNFLNEA